MKMFVMFVMVIYSAFSCYGADKLTTGRKPRPTLSLALPNIHEKSPEGVRCHDSPPLVLPPPVLTNASPTQAATMKEYEPLELIEITRADQILEILSGDIKGHVFGLDLDGTTFGFEGLLDEGLPGVLRTIAERGCYIMVMTARDSSRETRDHTYTNLLEHGIDLMTLAEVCAAAGGFKGFSNLINEYDEEGLTTQYDRNMLFVGGGTLVGTKGPCFEKLCQVSGIKMAMFKGVHLFDDSHDEHGSMHRTLSSSGMDKVFSPLRANFSKQKESFE